MKLTIKEIKKLQVLSALNETEQDLSKLVNDFDSITAFVKQVCDADIDDTEYNKAVEIDDLREDVIMESMSIEDVLLNAPEKEGTSFAVPKVVE